MVRVKTAVRVRLTSSSACLTTLNSSDSGWRLMRSTTWNWCIASFRRPFSRRSNVPSRCRERVSCGLSEDATPSASRVGVRVRGRVRVGVRVRSRVRVRVRVRPCQAP